MSKVLVVDDDQVNRMILKGMLVKAGHEVVEAENGRVALEKFDSEAPQLVLMDVMMPEMDGFEATRLIKERATDQYIPVIVLTAMSDEEELVQCVSSGADDFLTKPFSHVVLMAKIKALQRTQDLYNTVQKQRDEIERNQQILLEEQVQASKIYNKMTANSDLLNLTIRSHMSPMSVFNGDLLIAAETPDGRSLILLTDATGHGLPAALAAFPVNDAFQAMAKKGMSSVEIIEELNRKLVAILPTEFFLCGALLEIAPDQKSCRVWNGGLPEVLVYRHASKAIIHRIKASSLPLGIVGGDSFQVTMTEVETAYNDTVLMYSDGATEAQNVDGEYFGEDRLINAVLASKDCMASDSVMREIRQFVADSSQSDDVSLIEYIAGQGKH